ncbi:hypothetical protein Anapl_12368 [Anas platyrhynchos]|uniref:Endomucin n=1 Tax=Anas platyrhynchos TaxID=8839 RepID=R0KRM7_ANAPL|nr:hypothetical protein Anapl_12368 [Anas platyrhynchos]
MNLLRIACLLLAALCVCTLGPWCWVMLGAAFGGAEEHRGSAGTKVSFPAFVLFPVGEIVAAPSLSFLSCGLAASRRYQPAAQGSAASPTWGSVVLLVIQHGAVIRDTAFPSPETEIPQSNADDSTSVSTLTSAFCHRGESSNAIYAYGKSIRSPLGWLVGTTADCVGTGQTPPLTQTKCALSPPETLRVPKTVSTSSSQVTSLQSSAPTANTAAKAMTSSVITGSMPSSTTAKQGTTKGTTVTTVQQTIAPTLAARNEVENTTSTAQVNATQLAQVNGTQATQNESVGAPSTKRWPLPPTTSPQKHTSSETSSLHMITLTEPSNVVVTESSPGNKKIQEDTIHYSSVILPVVITLIVITLTVFSLVALYRICHKKTPAGLLHARELLPAHLLRACGFGSCREKRDFCSSSACTEGFSSPGTVTTLMAQRQENGTEQKAIHYAYLVPVSAITLHCCSKGRTDQKQSLAASTHLHGKNISPSASASDGPKTLAAEPAACQAYMPFTSVPSTRATCGSLGEIAAAAFKSHKCSLERIKRNLRSMRNVAVPIFTPLRCNVGSTAFESDVLDPRGMPCTDQLGFASPASTSQHLLEVLGENDSRRKAPVPAPIASHLSWSPALPRALGKAGWQGTVASAGLCVSASLLLLASGINRACLAEAHASELKLQEPLWVPLGSLVLGVPRPEASLLPPTLNATEEPNLSEASHCACNGDKLPFSLSNLQPQSQVNQQNLDFKWLLTY